LKSNQQKKVAVFVTAVAIKLELFGAMFVKKVEAPSQVTSFIGPLVNRLKITLQTSI